MLGTENSYTFDELISAVKRRLHILGYVSLPLVVATISVALFLPNVYESSARIDVNLEGSNVDTLEPIAVTTYADQYMANLRDRVVTKDNLNLLVSDDVVFSGELADLSVSERSQLIRDGFFVTLITLPVMGPRGRTFDLITGFNTGYQGPEPEFAHLVAEFVSDSFLNEDRRSRRERASSTSSFLQQQISSTESEIVAMEGEVADFKVKNACCLPELKELNMSIIQRAERDIEGLQPRVRTLEQDRIFLQAQLEEIRKRSVSTDRLSILEEQYLSLVANYGPDHPDVARVRREISAITNLGPQGGGGQELLELRVELAEKERRYSDIHPDVISLKRRIASLETDEPANEQKGRNRLLDNPRYLQLRSEINAIDTELTTLRARAPELRQKITEYENRLTRTPQIESEYQALNRKLDTVRQNFDDLQDRLVIARQTEALESTEIGARLTEVLSPSLPITPVGPPRLAISILGIFLAVSFGFGALITTEMMDTSVRGRKDIERAIQVVPIAAIPIVQNSVALANNRRQMIIVMGTALLLIVAVVIIYSRVIA